ncbi:RagB/SusD family nutrient uptake outer membrane protein [Flavobacterium sp.]|uniref:RagB/SusD family nutrient uptake outer membrane protein n=1 Tax=Flavobacterium sp. TaxID=239 RepID=UPI00261ED6B4|nr:RagB/SusD family nutrient uptake outer membrane protein [Flavobacterium sp.]
MRNIKFIKFIVLSSFVFISATSCTNLDEEALDGTIQSEDQGGTVDTGAFLATAYNGLREFQNQGNMFAFSEMSTDALVGPTRGGDWDDNGAWRQMHTLTWDPVHVHVRDTWNILLSNVYNCNQVINNNASASNITQARFLRAFYYYNVIDLFGQTPYRGTDLKSDAKVYTRAEATNYVISELEAILPALPARVAGDASVANKDAAYFLLAKLYLNKGVFTAASPQGPYTFSAADMTKVVSYVDAISSSLAPAYWDNFKPNNNTSPEILFSSKNIRSGSGGGIQSRWRMCQHYNQTPGGWNGFATVAEYYNRFNAADSRLKYSDAGTVAAFGNPAGFQVGQQYAPGGVKPLEDRNGRPLVFTPSVTMITSGTTLETAGIRAEKYVPDAVDLGAPENDYVFFRYADALLMKAEAITRGGSGSIGTILTDLATRANVTPAPATLEGIYAERGRELWWEGWRRNDMIRFGKYLGARELKTNVSDPKYLLLPIPSAALLNPNLKQNPGY